MAINRLAVVRGVSLRHCDTAGVALFAVAFFFMAGPVGAWAQALPAFNWIREVDNSGLAYSFAASLGTDAQGNVYVVGSTTSLNFPVKNAVQSQSASPGSYDVVVTKFDPAGNIVYSTYFGGNADDIARRVELGHEHIVRSRRGILTLHRVFHREIQRRRAAHDIHISLRVRAEARGEGVGQAGIIHLPYPVKSRQCLSQGPHGAGHEEKRGGDKRHSGRVTMPQRHTSNEP